MFEIFSPRIEIKNITSLQQLKDELLKQKAVHHKYRYIIQDMNEEQLKDFVYTGKYDKVEFEGVGKIFMHLYNRNSVGLMQYILGLKLNNLSILRLVIFALENENKYEGLFLQYIKEFKLKYEKKFKNLLFELGTRYEIDRLDILNIFINLL